VHSEVNTKDHHIPVVRLTNPTTADVISQVEPHQGNEETLPEDTVPVAEGRDPGMPYQIADPAPPTENVTPTVTITRSGRVSRPPRNLTEDMIVYKALQDISMIDPDIDWMSPLAYAALADPDVMYLHEALLQPDKAEFLKAMIEEVERQTMNKNWVIIERSKLPRKARVLPCVWAMRRKRRILDGTVYKWKARLKVDGGKQIRGIDYWETYAPVATWMTIRIVLIMAIKEQWCIKQ
jgi:Reverse transcriptase (RNA-dependent DNA polymerase)